MTGKTPSSTSKLRLAGFAAATLLGVAPAQNPLQPGASWATATPESVGLSSSALASGISALGWPARNGPLMVVANGRVVYSVGDIARRESTFSCSKLVTNMLAAKALQDGRLASLDVAVPNAPLGAAGLGYSGAATLRHFLTMTSDYGLPSPRPGGRYAYNNNAVDFFGEFLSQGVFGRTGADQMHLLVQQQLFAVTGQQDGAAFVGQWGGWSGGLQVSVRDLGRLGYLLLRNGTWGGQRVLAPQFVDGLFQSQIPSSAARYQSANPTENSQWNQQAVTNQLGGNWSFGTWRVDTADVDGHWVASAAEGFRGKRVILMPRGTLADPHLEVMLVCLPVLNDEGPTSSQYRQVIRNAELPHAAHPEHDPAFVAATFDDGTLYPLQSRLGAPFVRDGGLVLDGESRLVLAQATTADTKMAWRLSGGLPRGAWSGAIFRAATPGADHGTLGGGQLMFRLWHRSNGVVEAEIVAPSLGSPITSSPLTWVDPASPLTISVTLVGSTLQAIVNGLPVFPNAGATGLPSSGVSGYSSLRHGGAFSGAQRVDYVLARPAGVQSAYFTIDTEGEHNLVVFEDNWLPRIDPASWLQEFEFPGQSPVGLPIVLFGDLVRAFWPTPVGFDFDHLALSSRGAPVDIPLGTGLVFDYRALREGDVVR
jgi:CubicO group peptidase (beta-lactamase class C family)